jgi:hypothetical protein
MAKTSAADPPAGPDAAKVATIAAGVLGGLLALAGLALFNGRVALSVFAGAVIAVANLASLTAIIRAMLQPAVDDAAAEERAKEEAAASPPAEGEPEEPPEPAIDHAAEGKRGGAGWGLFALLKMVLLFGGIWVLLTRHLVDPIPLVVGYGVLPVAIAVSGVLTSLAPRPRGRRPRTRTE